MLALLTTPTPRRLNPIAAMPPATRWSSVAVALLLSACAHSPQAALPTPGLQSGVMPWGQTAISPCDKEPTASPRWSASAVSCNPKGWHCRPTATPPAEAG